MGVARFDQSANWTAKVRNVSRLGSQTKSTFQFCTLPATPVLRSNFLPQARQDHYFCHQALRLQVEFQNGDWVEPSFLVVLNVGHVEEFVSDDDSRGHPFKQGIAAFENIEPLDRAEIVGQGEPNNSWRHESVLNREQRAAIEVK